MPVLVAAVALTAALCLVNLLLTFGVLGRLREHAKLLGEPRMPSEVMGLLPGEAPGAFTAVSSTGRQVCNTTGVRVAAFFSTECSVCSERVKPFISYVSTRKISQERVLAVIVANGAPNGGDLTSSYVKQLASVATVCSEQHDGGISAAFKVNGFPAFCLLDDDGLLTASGYDPAMLSALVA
jgi:hypothetical protein